MVVNSIAKVGRTVVLFAVLVMVAIGAGLVIARYMGGPVVVPPVTFDASSQTSPSAPVEPPVAIQTKVPVRGTESEPAERSWTNQWPEVDFRPWDQRLDDILLGTIATSANDKSDAILKLMAVAPEDAQAELAEHLINMTQDDHYDGVAGLLTNAATQTAVSTRLMNDLLNRRNSLKLPMLLAIASNNDHPLKDQAKDMLELFLQADYSTNWDQWGTAVDDWLQQNP
jgi:hypothetical protein